VGLSQLLEATETQSEMVAEIVTALEEIKEDAGATRKLLQIMLELMLEELPDILPAEVIAA
jgi:hypothetical protein